MPAALLGRMTLIGFLLLILVGAICGFIAEMLVGYSPGGFIASVVVGFLGALIGTWVATAVGLPSLFAVNIEGHSIEILWAVLGAVLLLAVLSLVRRSRSTRY
jgi:uncharacterized membrane protein YeaQ/YmgE (transglycosylase-associated protein family)